MLFDANFLHALSSGAEESTLVSLGAAPRIRDDHRDQQYRRSSGSFRSSRPPGAWVIWTMALGRSFWPHRMDESRLGWCSSRARDGVVRAPRVRVCSFVAYPCYDGTAG